MRVVAFVKRLQEFASLENVSIGFECARQATNTVNQMHCLMHALENDKSVGHSMENQTQIALAPF